MKINFNNYKNLLKVTGLFTGVHGLNIVLNVSRNKIAALLIGPMGMGLASIYNETRELLHTMTNCGLDIAGIRGISQKVEQLRNATDAESRRSIERDIDERVRLLRSWIVIFALFGTMFCLLLAEPISWLTFSDLDHIWGYVFLSPAVGLSTMTCGELTILKATQRLKALATVSVLNVALAIIIALPFYQLMGTDGILPALVSLSLAQFCATSCYSWRSHRPKFCFQRIYLRSGVPMMKVGIAFTLTNIVSHGAQLGIRAMLNDMAGGGDAGLAEVGYYSAAYSIAIVYGSVIFASLDNEFFPRLTGIFDNLEARRTAVWRQVRVSVLLAIPCAIGLVVLLPWILPILLTNEFGKAITMAQFASVGIIFRAIYLPLAYIPLAAGHSRVFMSLEFLSYLVLFISVLTGYRLGGLDGAGIALAVSIFIDMCIILSVAKIKYKV